MSKRKGSTLLEVIMAIAILGIISIGFLVALSNHFVLLNKTKDISQEVFLTQREMEIEIDDVKEKIRNKELSLKEKTIFNNLGGIKVNYYEIEKTKNNKAYYTLVSDVKPYIPDPIELKNIGIELKQGSKDVPYGYATGGFNIVGDFKNDNTYKTDHLLNVIEWYVSTEEYTTLFPKNPSFSLDDDIVNNSYYYPLFPRDYMLVANETINDFGSFDRTFSDLYSYAGRHIVFTVTPGAKSGKIGKQSVSDPVFISGLPITENLVSHFDAGFIDPSDTSIVMMNDKINNVKKWNDISSIYGGTKPSEAANVISKNPKLMKMGMETGYKWQYVEFSDDNQYLEIKNQNTNGNNIDVFAIVRNRVGDEEPVFLKNGEYEFRIFKEDSSEGPSSDKWYLVEDSITSQSNQFIIGGLNVDIAEIVIYKGGLTSEKIQTLENYFNVKYKEPIVVRPPVEDPTP